MKKETQMVKKFKNGDLIHPVCPICGCSLLCYKNLIDGEATIKLIISPGDGKWNRYVHLCRIWGDFNKMVEEQNNIPEEQKIKEGDQVAFYCPHCYSLLETNEKCDKCNSLMFYFLETDEKHIVGMVEVCSRYKCHFHRWKPIPKDHEFKKWSTNNVKHKKVKQFLLKKGEIPIFNQKTGGA